MTKTGKEDTDIAAALDFINERVVTIVYKGSIEIGDYVIEKFFENNIDLAVSKNRYKSMSFQKLCKHPDLSVSSANLRRMVRTAAQEKFFLQNDIPVNRMKYSQKVELIWLANNDDKLALARLCVGKSISVRALRARIESLPEKQIPATTRVRRFIDRAVRWMENQPVKEMALTGEIAGQMEAGDREALVNRLTRLEVDMKQMGELVDHLKAVLGADYSESGGGEGEPGSYGDSGEAASGGVPEPAPGEEDGLVADENNGELF
ncbi:MAG: NAD-glutamate dehydrogenase [Deltaproteobacteria bacterium]|nr:NAD-glutamate dehydrogenase [Deltaproteobacteria bacterium]